MSKIKSESSSWKDALFVFMQYILPHHLISRTVLKLTRVKTKWFKRAVINWVVKRYNVDVSEAENEDLESYDSFNAFFTRTLKASVRPISQQEKTIVCPVDGAVSQIGAIESGTIYQAKGYSYTAKALLGGDERLEKTFQQGHFATLYLSPRDYHRIHMPLTGQLEDMVYVPGRLFSVNQTTVRRVPNLFSRNERVVTVFNTEYGRMAVVLVGALNVGCMETVWHGVVTPPRKPSTYQWQYDEKDNIQLKLGDELGRFNMGSTVVLLFENENMQFTPELGMDSKIKMGQAIGLFE